MVKNIMVSNRVEYAGNGEKLIDMSYSPYSNCKP